MSEAVRKQMIYLASVDVLRRLLRSGKVSRELEQTSVRSSLS